ncbi:MAG: TauD/TfdA family dioxygenase [Burkholderiaceae bacterium]|nr:TauD/TfdA family dioxygenase [Burkholderiaceae bacterium]
MSSTTVPGRTACSEPTCSPSRPPSDTRSCSAAAPPTASIPACSVRCPTIRSTTSPPSTPSSTRETGVNWHSDLSYTTRPTTGSLLYCVEIPEIGGDTRFTNMYLAHEAL